MVAGSLAPSSPSSADAVVSKSIEDVLEYLEDEEELSQKLERLADLCEARSELPIVPLGRVLRKVASKNVATEALSRFLLCPLDSSTLDAISVACDGSSSARVLAHLVSRGDVKRAWACRGALDKDCDGHKEDLARAAAHPNFVKSAQGRRFVGLLLARPDSSAHSVVKAQLCLGTAKLAVAFGDCYYRAWQENGSLVEELLQDLARCALLCESDDLHSKLRVVLGSALHERKAKDKGIDDAIDRVYAPLMWRALVAAHATCRVRAVRLLGEAFPVVSERPPASGEASAASAAIERQLELLRKALFDDTPAVREAAADACGSVLSRFAGALPKARVVAVVKDLSVVARDSSSPAVRLAALSALNRLSKHAVPLFEGGRAVADKHVKAALLASRKCAHDIDAKCREAFFKVVSTYAKYVSQKPQEKSVLDIVGADEIIARLAVDRAKPVADRLVSMFVANAYFPSASAVSPDHVERAVAFANKDAVAAKAFYSRLPSVASLESCAQFVVMLAAGARSALKEDAELGATMLEIAATTLDHDYRIHGDEGMAAFVAEGVDQVALAKLVDRLEDDDARIRARIALESLTTSSWREDDEAEEDLVDRLGAIENAADLDDLAVLASRCRDEALLSRLCDNCIVSIGSVSSSSPEEKAAATKKKEQKSPAKRRRRRRTTTTTATPVVTPAAAVFVLERILASKELTAAKAAVLRSYERLSTVVKAARDVALSGQALNLDGAALVELEASLATSALYGGPREDLRNYLDDIVAVCRGTDERDREEGPRRKSRRRSSQNRSTQMATTSGQNAAVLEAAIGVRDYVCPWVASSVSHRDDDIFSDDDMPPA